MVETDRSQVIEYGACAWLAKYLMLETHTQNM